MANYGAETVSKFAVGGTKPAATLAGVPSLIALTCDADGNLYVACSVAATVSEFAAKSTTVTATLGGVNGPDALAFDLSGNLYVANSSGNTVSKFLPGGTMPATTLTGLTQPGEVLVLEATQETCTSTIGARAQVGAFAAAAARRQPRSPGCIPPMPWRSTRRGTSTSPTRSPTR